MNKLKKPPHNWGGFFMVIIQVSHAPGKLLFTGF